MSRLEEVEQTIKSILHCAENFRVESDALQHLARILAAEVDARDEVIGRLLAMLKDNEPGRIHGVTYYTDAQNKQAELYHRACEIAERTE